MEELFPGKRVITLLGVLQDKNAEGIIRHLEEFTTKFILTEPPSDRKLDTKEVSKLMSKPYELINDPDEAVKKLQEEKDEYDVALAAGSLYLIGHIRRYLL